MSHNSLHRPSEFPPEQGLYDPSRERDACGVGFICNMNGKASHGVIHQALEILVRLSHRGAESSDNRTGDGAGILIQIPHSFFWRVAKALTIKLPPPGEYGTGLVYLPKDKAERKQIMDRFEAEIVENGQRFLGWRTLPVNRNALGEIAAKSEPHIEQIFIGRGDKVHEARAFERELYIIRKGVEQWVARHPDLKDKKTFYVPSLSHRTIIYKGLLKPEDFEPYFTDLLEKDVETCLALVHQRYSTNTFPAWRLAQPFRFVCHNGEINTVQGNANWMNARQAQFQSAAFGERISKLFPICMEGNSDSATLDNTLELLYHTGRDLPHAMMMMVPEAWQNHKTMLDEKKAFYEYHSCMMEPWDGPALMPFTDGTFVGALLDRNGLRPARYLVTSDDQVIMASETGVVDIDPAKIIKKGRLEPGRMFLINLEEGRIVEDAEIKQRIANRKPYRAWLNEHMVNIHDLPPAKTPAPLTGKNLLTQQQMFGYTLEDLRIILRPMFEKGVEALGSMGVDVPLAVLSDKPQLMYNYFKQLFAQVTNPPLDAIREEIVTSLITNIGKERDLFQETPEHAALLKLEQPILTDRNLERIRQSSHPAIKAKTLPMLFDPRQGGKGLEDALNTLCQEAAQAVKDGYTILILSDRNAGKAKLPVPSLLAASGVHQHLIRAGLRTQAGLVVETAEAREVHHFACLFGFGVGAVNPYLALATVVDLARREGMDESKAVYNYTKAASKGVLKVMSKIGISTLQSYRGAQIFECVGLKKTIVERYFTGTASRIEGADMEALVRDVLQRHERAFPPQHIPENLELDVGGVYQWRRRGERHLISPMLVALLQKATKVKSKEDYKQFAKLVNEQSRELCTLRGLMDFDLASRTPVPLEEVEPWTEIVKRFKTGAMSYGSISREAHETLAIAMNRMGAKSNSGEGGEEEHRYKPDANGDSRSSAIKQVASGRFGVTSYYLTQSKEIQIKMAQGAKPGEGGQLPGLKVNQTIAKARFSTPYVGLVSPPPHHDIYSIEDLAQLIHDLKNANKYARINVKLVSEVGVGVVAAGVAKGKADVVLISGYDGGTGASPETSLKHAGLPWELGIAEAHQTLLLNDLRSRIVVECDGKLMTGRDVAIATLLGAEEFGFSTAPLMVMGCIMMRVCHLNTCPVGIATQNPELRKKFTGTPDSVINFFHLVAEELREIMASLGFRKLTEMVGHSEVLNMRTAIDHYKAKGLDFSRILHRPQVPASYGMHKMIEQDHGLDQALDNELIEYCQNAIDVAEPLHFEMSIRNVNRTVGTMLSAEISRRYGEAGLPDNTIQVDFAGHAGQSFGAFLTRGVTFALEGDANDYFGKGLSGGRLIVHPPRVSPFRPEQNVIIGNVALFGATRGEAFIQGLAGERFAVRNSGANAVVEGLGDHGCEYMTGGRVVVLGPTGRNFAAGMSGGVAYVLDLSGDFSDHRCNHELVDLEDVVDPADVDELRDLIERHYRHTESNMARKVMDDWEDFLPKFVKIMPRDYKLALERLAREREQAQLQVALTSEDLNVKQN
jgi:glutamate synthase domain-containing protein 2/glutamate synthase domain-containing protein 1/glutamate synthase domain-containing protein 3